MLLFINRRDIERLNGRLIIDEPPLAPEPSCNPQALASGDAVSPSAKPLGILKRPQAAGDEQKAYL